MKIKKDKILKYIAIAAGIVFILFFYRCPIKLFLGIDCPGCGMTRALKSFVMLDFKAAFGYHPMIFVIIPEAVYYVFSRYIIKKQLSDKTENIVLLSTAIIMILLWIYRQFISKLISG